jgi:hypothetical protein
MRRGAALNEGGRRRPVVADLDDLEGGGGAEDNGKPSPYMRSGSNDSFSAASSGSLDMPPIHSPTSGKDKKRRIKHSYSGAVSAYFTGQSSRTLQLYAMALMAMTGCVCPFLPIHWCILTLVSSSCVFGIIASLWLSRSVLTCDDGTPEMRMVSDPIREGAEGFLRVQYSAIAKFAVPLAGLIILSYQFRPSSGEEAVGVAVLGNRVLGMVAAFGFIAGALCSAASGYTAMWVAAQSNIRVASASRRSYGEALVVCFRGGAFSAVLNLTLCIAGVTTLYTVLHFTFSSAGGKLVPTDIPMLLVGYGFGASFVALFMQLGGGIYTKVGGDRQVPNYFYVTVVDQPVILLCSFLLFYRRLM